MSLKRALLTLAAVAVVAAGIGTLGLGAGLFSSGGDRESAQQGHGGESEEPVTSAVWVRYDSLKKASRDAIAVVEAQVTAVRKGPDDVYPEPGEPEGEIRFPTQDIEFRTLRVLGGSHPPTFTLSKDETARTSLAEGDPPYIEGKKYVLFIRHESKKRSGVYIIIGPDGRHSVTSSGRLKPVLEGPVSDALRNKTVAQLKRKVKRFGTRKKKR